MTTGNASLLRVFRTDDRLGVSMSVSVSEGRACLFGRSFPPEAAPFRGVLATSSSPTATTRSVRSLFLDIDLDAGGSTGGGIEVESLSPSLLIVPSWLLGISVMPRLDRLILERAASIFRERGRSCWVKISMRSDFLAEEGY